MADDAPLGDVVLGVGRWDALALLDGIDRSRFGVSAAYIEAQRDDIWRDLYAEYDARHFMLRVLRGRAAQTPLFRRLIDLWWQDEKHHAQGFARLYRLFFGRSEIDLYDELSLRRADFSRIDHLMDDAFSVCVLLAFDELVTTGAYREDRRFYRGLGVPAFGAWVRNLVADEARHFANAVKVLKAEHADRLDEAPALIDELVRLDCAPDPYQATFVLDHFDENYGEPMLRRSAEELKRVLAQSLA